MSFQGTRYVWSLDVPMPLPPPPPMPPTPPPPPPPHVAQFCCVKRRTTRKAARERASSDFIAVDYKRTCHAKASSSGRFSPGFTDLQLAYTVFLCSTKAFFTKCLNLIVIHQVPPRP